jgi:4-amino-4-deoxy-L-arabinose transferase-like glycosyltransferase
MRTEPPAAHRNDDTAPADAPRWCLPAVVLAAVVGLGVMAESARSTSAAYDEVTYLNVASRWWRTGEQAEIARMGSPLTFWKLQQAPTLWVLDRLGYGELTDGSEASQERLLPLARLGALWVWLAAFGLTACWSRRLHGPRAMALAAWLFALSPNLLAHGGLVTMEMPLTAAAAAAFLLFWRFLRTGNRGEFLGSAMVCGLAFSCKFTAVLFPPLLGLAWWADRWKLHGDSPVAATARVARGMIGFGAVMLLADLAVTGFATLPLTHETAVEHPSIEARLGRWPGLAAAVSRAAETPLPQDLVGFATQMQHQKSGGPSYLLGERRMRGWWYYYLVALAVKVPLSFWVLLGARGALARGSDSDAGESRAWFLPLMIAAFLAVTAAGSARNYGVRYLLPLAPLAVVWVSSLAERRHWLRGLAWAGVAGQVLAVASVFPDELTYFNAVAGGRSGGRAVLADSNLDWGQGLKGLARLQRARPELRDLTLYYFGERHTAGYGVAGVRHVIDAGEDHPGLPERFRATTRYVAVSASLQWGPWGPPGYFRALDGAKPVAMTDDTTIAVYRTADVLEAPRQ